MKIFLVLLIVAAASGIKIECEFKYRGWGPVGSLYTCNVISIDFSDDVPHVTGYTGTHMSGRSASDVGGVWFYPICVQTPLTAMPERLSNFFPNIVGLYFYKCAINTLNGEELKDYPNLQFWGHNQSNLTQIPGNFFALTPSLKYLEMYSNQIKHVGGGLLDHLHNLGTAAMHNNVCVNKWAKNSTEVLELIQILRENCKDIELETTTNGPGCIIGNFEEKFQEKIESLEEINRNLSANNEALERTVGTQAAMLAELELKVINLSSKPCEC